jgi:hypothetical protein
MTARAFHQIEYGATRSAFDLIRGFCAVTAWLRDERTQPADQIQCNLIRDQPGCSLR